MSEVKQKWITWSKDNGCYCGLYDDGDPVGNDARLEFAGFEAGYRKQQKRIDELQKRINKALVICEVNKNIKSEKTTHFSEGFESGASMCAHDIEKALRGEHDI